MATIETISNQAFAAKGTEIYLPFQQHVVGALRLSKRCRVTRYGSKREKAINFAHHSEETNEGTVLLVVHVNHPLFPWSITGDLQLPLFPVSDQWVIPSPAVHDF